MSASIEVINSLEKLCNAVKDIRTVILNPPKSRTAVEEAKEILTSHLRCGFLKLSDITEMKLMYEQGLTEQEAVEIIAYLQSLGL